MSLRSASRPESGSVSGSNLHDKFATDRQSSLATQLTKKTITAGRPKAGELDASPQFPCLARSRRWCAWVDIDSTPMCAVHGEHDESYKNFTDMSLLLRNTDSQDFSSGD
jgi:hypothetical protein